MTQVDFQSPQPYQTHVVRTPVSVQLLSTVFFGVFGILAVIFAFNASWVVGLIVALVLGWRGGFAPPLSNATAVPSPQNLMPKAPAAMSNSSGNASFDAYKTDTLDRLEREQIHFGNFLGRLRDAKDKSEFDDFLDQRARSVATTSTSILQEPAGDR